MAHFTIKWKVKERSHYECGHALHIPSHKKEKKEKNRKEKEKVGQQQSELLTNEKKIHYKLLILVCSHADIFYPIIF